MLRRERFNREFWLIDIGAIGSIENAEFMLNSLFLDLDDDVFVVYFSNDNMADLWEIYKLRPTMDLMVKPLGTWTIEKGFEITEKGKWKRRGNLMVCIVHNTYV